MSHWAGSVFQRRNAEPEHILSDFSDLADIAHLTFESFRIRGSAVGTLAEWATTVEGHKLTGADDERIVLIVAELVSVRVVFLSGSKHFSDLGSDFRFRS